MRTELAWNDRGRVLVIRLANGSRMLPPLSRPLEVRVAGGTQARTVDETCRLEPIGNPFGPTLSPMSPE